MFSKKHKKNKTCKAFSGSLLYNFNKYSDFKKYPCNGFLKVRLIFSHNQAIKRDFDRCIKTFKFFVQEIRKERDEKNI